MHTPPAFSSFAFGKKNSEMEKKKKNKNTRVCHSSCHTVYHKDRELQLLQICEVIFTGQDGDGLPAFS